MEQNSKSKQFETELAKSKAEKTMAEMKQFAEEEEIELSPGDVEIVSGGYDPYPVFPLELRYCVHCGSRNGEVDVEPFTYGLYWQCFNCGEQSHYGKFHK